MKDIKNYIIAVLAGLLVLTLSIQPSQGAGTSKDAKIVQYTTCLQLATSSYLLMDVSIANCKRYQP
jgi:ABC-type iron transport system FetAB permease component